MSTDTSSIDELPERVRERVLGLPDDTWAGPLDGFRCSNCGENSWVETDDDLGYEGHWAHYEDAYECLSCSRKGGWITNARQDSPLTRRVVGCLEQTGDFR